MNKYNKQQRKTGGIEKYNDNKRVVEVKEQRKFKLRKYY